MAVAAYSSSASATLRAMGPLVVTLLWKSSASRLHNTAAMSDYDLIHLLLNSIPRIQPDQDVLARLAVTLEPKPYKP